MPDAQMLMTCALIVLGRVCDVTLGTLRTLFVVQGRRNLACILGFFEVLIWVLVIARVITGLQDNYLYALSYALGFATGNFMGITVESWLAFGNQALFIFTRKGGSLVPVLRTFRVRVTEFAGRGRDGRISLLIIIVRRDEAAKLVRMVSDLDPDCFLLLEDVRYVSKLAKQLHSHSNWRDFLKK